MFEFTLPIKTVSEINSSEHWTKKMARRRSQQMFIRLSFGCYIKNLELPCVVKMTRLGPRTLESDNLPTAFKYIRDELAECILPEYRRSYMTSRGKMQSIKGWADSDPRIIWEYAQEKNSTQGIKIEIKSAGSNV